MPQLVGVLNRSLKKKKTVGGATGGNVLEEEGVEWATVWVFACVKECCDDVEKGEAWREERVFVEWET